MPERVRTYFEDAGADTGSKKRKRDHPKQPLETTLLAKASLSEFKKSHDDSIPHDSPHQDGENQPFRSHRNQPQGSHYVRKAIQKPLPSPLKARAEALLSARKSLPIWNRITEIRQGLREKDVLLLVGETGSGKSTQVPQLLLDEKWCKPRQVKPSSGQSHGSNRAKQTIGGCIAVTEPRRVAAITLARRVAEEMGSLLGPSSPASRVGYSVRFDNSTSPCTRIKFLTEGMLLQEMLRDPWLSAYSAVIVDEVHERGVNVDLVLGFLRKITGGKYEGRQGVPLKVVVMSATAEMEHLKDFFEAGYYEPDSMSDKTRDGKQSIKRMVDAKEEDSEWSGISNSDSEEKRNSDHTRSHSNDLSEKAKGKSTGTTGNSDETSILTSKTAKPHVATCHIEGRQYPVTIKYTPEPVQDIVDSALRTVFQIHRKEPMPGDILVFLTGQETVESLESLVKEYAEGLGPDVPKILVLPLFAALPQAAQQRVFQPAAPKVRKVIIATNIAETSVTVSGVRFVIDCGKAKIKHFRSRIGFDSLLVKPISKSAAIQRKGRAGREAPGQCYRLYTEADYHTMEQSNKPEILRCDLSHAILTMKARGVGDVVNFAYLDEPPQEALEKALLQLYQVGALTDSGEISDIGLQMAKLPLTVGLGRVLIAAADPNYDCVLEIIDIISCLSVENVFLNLTSEEKKEEAETARRELLRREGDHLTLLTTVQAYAAEQTDRKAWAQSHFVSHRAMQAVMNVRKQLRQQSKILLRNDSQQQQQQHQDQQQRPLTPELATSILKCFLKGFATNTARLFPDGSYKTISGSQNVAIHPSSGLFGRKVEAIMYNEFVFTNKSYARGVSAVQMDWIAEAMGVQV
ncbi:Salivary acidic proline-rich phosphoprotein 1/2 [Lecanora helva]